MKSKLALRASLQTRLSHTSLGQSAAGNDLDN